ncbi:MAG TPA: UPF0182 family protein [Pyrinomonadaceae bacterium]
MDTPIPIDQDDKIIDIGPSKPRRNRRRIIIIAIVIALIFMLLRSTSIYVSALWFDSLGYSSVYWYIFRMKLFVFLIFAVLTVAILRTAFWLLERTFSASTLERRTIMVNNQALQINPARLFRPVAWGLSILLGLFFGLGMKDGWREFALYLNQPSAPTPDPIFHKPLSFYLFSLPVHQMLNKWLTMLAVVILIATVAFVILSSTQKKLSRAAEDAARQTSFAAVSFALAGLLIILAWRVYLARFPYLWQDHQSFSGVTYTEDNYYLPGLMIVAITLIVAAGVAVLNALTKRKLRLTIAAVALPILAYIVAGMLIPAYVQSFVVKPNELGRETPYIEHNIQWTRRAYKIEVEPRAFDPDISIAGFDLANNSSTLDNIRLWDWAALRDTLHQIQTIRPYYEFPDVDVDRYTIGGQTKQVMLAARELDVNKLPTQSRTWINEKLIYTHGYGVTMNTAKDFTAEGQPDLLLKNMPVEPDPRAPEIKVTRPEIYFGQETTTDVYVKTKQPEFNYPQGDKDNPTFYEGTGGIPLGGFFRRLILAWSLGDISKLPFSDAITSESRVLMRRNIRDRVNALAPFLMYDDDPYIVITNDGRLFWIMDAYTESATYPYSTHYRAGKKTVNYLRNSVKATIDAYNGNVDFYVFDEEDPLLKAYRAVFPALFKNRDQMPEDLRAHIRYPETLIRTQSDVFGLYHTTNASIFFQRQDVWSVASQAPLNRERQQQQVEALEPYFVLMKLPGEQTQNEFVEIVPFTPAGRQNMIGWMAGRSDGDAYGSLLVYKFPESRQIDGPSQIEARIDQDPTLSARFTLMNQQGSRVRRGNLLVIPIGSSLLYVEPVFLQSERTPIPELRFVILATKDRLEFGETTKEDPRPAYEIAREKFFGKPAQPGTPPKEEQAKDEPKPPAETPQPTTVTALPANAQQLIMRASEDFSEYQRLTAAGKLAEAGQKLEALKRDLEELKKITGKQ